MDVILDYDYIAIEKREKDKFLFDILRSLDFILRN